jgi:hypothetical protein
MFIKKAYSHTNLKEGAILTIALQIIRKNNVS